MEFTLSHSKTWPVNAVAVVQLRVDSNGKAYSTYMEKVDERFEEKNCDKNQEKNEDKINGVRFQLNEKFKEGKKDNGLILKLSHEDFELLTRSNGRCKTIRTDTVSTILEQEFESEIQNDQELETFHVLALTTEEEKPNIRKLPRQNSAKFDNWDLIYTETPKQKCPIHGDSPPCKSKGPPCMEHTDCMLPELPLDARKVTTLRRHYYPEGGWGWVIIACSVLVHVLNHGIQASCSQLVIPASTKFKTLPVHVAGK